MKNFKRILPHLIAVSTFLILASVYFSPIFNGYSLRQSDVKQFQGMQKEILDANLMNEEDALWTNAMFSGMPTYQISIQHAGNFMVKIDRVLKLGLPGPVGILFITMLGFYIFALCLKVNPWLSLLGAVAFGFSTINILYIGAGHVTKVNSIAYIAPALGGMILAFRSKWLLGSAIFALFFSLNITANHLQMTYYLILLMGAVAIAEIIRIGLKKDWLSIGKAVGGLGIASVLAILPAMGNLSTTFEYSTYTTRGTTDLTIKPKGNQKQTIESSGLNKNYILEYNYGKRELLSILAPSAQGEKGEAIGNDEKAMENVDSRYAQQISQMNRYWGGQRMSGGAFYFGVVMLVFAIFGLIFMKDSIKWPLLVIALLTLVLSTNNPGGLNGFFIDNFPMYNKFRDSKMILVLLQVIVPALAVLFLQKLFFQKEELWGGKKAWLITGGVLLFVSIVLYASPSISGSFLSKDEVKQFGDAIDGTKDPDQISYLEGLQVALKDVRIEMYKSDFGRSILLIILGLGVILVALYTKLSALVLTAVSFVFVLSDNMSVSKRYLNNEDLDDGNTHWEDVDRASTPYLPNVSDLSILEKEKKNVPGYESKVSALLSKMPESLNYKNMSSSDQRTMAEFGALNLNSDYRVLTFANPFSETTISYFHKSLGGYHGAKLKRYQEMIDFHISAELQKVNEEISAEKNAKLRVYASQMAIPQDQFQKVFDTIAVSEINLSDKSPVLNMLNTKYVVTNPNSKALENNNANGAVWFVNSIRKVANANQEMLETGKINSKTEAVVDPSSFSVKGKEIRETYPVDSAASIKLIKYNLNELRYVSNANTELPAIFSEVYYPAGWNCYIDNKLVPSFRANYILRGVIIPAGKHTIDWKFEPSAYHLATKVSGIGSIVLILLVGFIFFKESRIELSEK